MEGKCNTFRSKRRLRGQRKKLLERIVKEAGMREGVQALQ